LKWRLVLIGHNKGGLIHLFWAKSWD